MLTPLVIFSKSLPLEGKGCGYSLDDAVRKTLNSLSLEALMTAGVSIKAKTAVENSVLLYNLISAKYGGLVRVKTYEIISKDFNPKIDQICVEIKATFEVEDKIPETFGVKIFAPPKVKAYKTFKVSLTTDKTCYAYLYDVDTKGNVYNVLPKAIKIEKGKVYSITLRAYPLPNTPLPQQEKLIFVCSEKPNRLFSEGFTTLSGLPNRIIKHCLKDGTCISQEGEEELWGKLLKFQNWDFDFAVYQIEKP